MPASFCPAPAAPASGPLAANCFFFFHFVIQFLRLRRREATHTKHQHKCLSRCQHLSRRHVIRRAYLSMGSLVAAFGIAWSTRAVESAWSIQRPPCVRRSVCRPFSSTVFLYCVHVTPNNLNPTRRTTFAYEMQRWRPLCLHDYRERGGDSRASMAPGQPRHLGDAASSPAVLVCNENKRAVG